MTENDEQTELARETGALPREIEPARDLWAGVAQRIEAKRRRVVLLRRGVAGASVLLAAAAIALVIRAERHPQATGPAPRSIASEPTALTTGPVEPPAMTPLIPEEASYRTALAALTPVFEERRKDLPADGAAALGKSLGAIDAAITTTRASLATQPEDDDLRRELDSEYQLKIDTMNDVLDWTTRS